MDILAKNKKLLDFCTGLSFDQMVVFSDEGNLHNRYLMVNESQETQDKPHGLWFSYGDAWLGYLLDEQNKSWARKRLRDITHVYELKLNGNMLNIFNSRQFNEFEKKYARRNKDVIDWGRVSQTYGGIKIKYFPERGLGGDSRYHSPWYWHWDVSSGAVWDREAVQDINLLISFEHKFELMEI